MAPWVLPAQLLLILLLIVVVIPLLIVYHYEFKIQTGWSTEKCSP